MTELGPTRPDKLTLWPIEGDRYGIDVVYLGQQGWRRATVVHRQLGGAGLASRFIQEVDQSCQRGHVFDETNTYRYTDAGGAEHRVCRRCRADRTASGTSSSKS